MNKHVLENLLIFSILYANSHKVNKGKTHPSYMDDKSHKYLGIYISDYDLGIDDFTIESPVTCAEEYERDPLYPCKILDNIKDRVKLSELRDYNNLVDDGTDFFGDKQYRINGLDFQNSSIFKNIYKRLDEEYFKRVLREFNAHIILEEE